VRKEVFDINGDRVTLDAERQSEVRR
jgi:hypothetical protein